MTFVRGEGLDLIRQVAPRHQIDRLRAENPCAVQVSVVDHHLAEGGVIGNRRSQCPSLRCYSGRYPVMSTVNLMRIFSIALELPGQPRGSLLQGGVIRRI